MAGRTRHPGGSLARRRPGVSGRYPSQPGPAELGGQRMIAEQADAFAQLRRLAAPARLRVPSDAEGWPVIPGRLGQIQRYCNGPDCHGCPLPGELALAVYTDRPRLFPRLWAIPGARRWQTGDREIRAVFPPGALPAVAEVIRARRRRAQSLAQTQNLAKGPRSAGSQRQNRVAARTGPEVRRIPEIGPIVPRAVAEKS